MVFQDDGEKLLPFNLEAEYLQGAHMLIADYGSRAPRQMEAMKSSELLTVTF